MLELSGPIFQHYRKAKLGLLGLLGLLGVVELVARHHLLGMVTQALVVDSEALEELVVLEVIV